MKSDRFKFNRMELAGSLGDLGTLIPLFVALIVLCKLSITSVLLLAGIYYVASGVFFRLPMPVQPLKVVSALAIAMPAQVTPSILAATAMVFGLVTLVVGLTGLIDWIAKLFTKPIVRGIQLGLGFILVKKGIGFILDPNLFSNSDASYFQLWGISANLILGIVGCAITLILITNKKIPAALFVITIGFALGIAFGSIGNTSISFGPTPVEFYFPSSSDFFIAITLLVIPQIPLTIGNAIIGTKDTSKSLFGKGEITERVTNRNLSISMGLANLVTGIVGGIPMCHGAGGLAAHYRFGARTGGSNIIIGLIFMIIAILFGSLGITLLTSLPNAIFGILLVFAGLELATLIKDIRERNDLFVVVLIASVAIVSTNMSIAFAVGIAVSLLIRIAKIEL